MKWTRDVSLRHTVRRNNRVYTIRLSHSFTMMNQTMMILFTLFFCRACRTKSTKIDYKPIYFEFTSYSRRCTRRIEYACVLCVRYFWSGLNLNRCKWTHLRKSNWFELIKLSEVESKASSDVIRYREFIAFSWNLFQLKNCSNELEVVPRKWKWSSVWLAKVKPKINHSFHSL